MFHTLHRLMILCFWGLVVALLAVAYQKRAVLMPAYDFFRAVQIWSESRGAIVGELNGKVVRVTSGDSFQLEDAQGRLFNLKLAGVEAPDIVRNMPQTELRWSRLSKTNLEELILSKDVRVEVTYLAQQSGVGIVHVGKTNVNLAMVEAGMAQVMRDYLKGVPFEEKYAFLRAARKAYDAKAGLWDEKAGLPPETIQEAADRRPQ